ncbi:MAG: NAD-dependent epimerase/dehydratase family protein [Nanoarchaeota archaeon]
MNLILTGHKGLIGKLLKTRLENEGHKIILGLDKKEGKDTNFLDDYLPPVQIDMTIHTAAFCKINKCIEEPELGHLNGINSFKVLEFCRKNNVPKMAFLSSSRTLSPEKNPYTAGKLYGEELCKAYKECYGINYLIIRPSTVYGGDALDETQRLVHIFIKNALLGKDLVIYGNPKTKTLDFTHLEDFVEGTLLAINHPQWNKEYNISGNEETNIYDLAKYIIKETRSKSEIIFKEKEKAQPQKVYLDISEIQKLGYSPKIKLFEGIKRNIETYKKFLDEGKLF